MKQGNFPLQLRHHTCVNDINYLHYTLLKFLFVVLCQEVMKVIF